MEAWIFTIASLTVVSLISIIGVVTLSINKDFLQAALRFLVSFAVGGLFGDAFIHLLPESFEKLGINHITPLYVIAGIMIFFVLEKFIRWRHCHVPTSQAHTHPVVALNLIGDGVHNFIDGMVIAASYMVSVPVGIATSLAVIFHEIPQEFGDFAVLVNGGLPVKKALFFNFVCTLAAFLGGIITLLLGNYLKGSVTVLLPITAGGFIYIAGSDLIPGLHEGCDIKASHAFFQLMGILLGVLVMVALTFLEVK